MIVAIERESTWCVTLAMVRGGRHLGDRSFFPQNAAGSDAATVVEAFIAQHYAQQPVPARVVSDQVENAADLEHVLSGIAGRVVKVVTRPIGENRTWLEMARRKDDERTCGFAREWAAFSELPIEIVDGSPEARQALYAARREGFLIINYEQLLRDLKPDGVFGVDVRGNNAITAVADADHLTGKHGAACGGRW